MNSDRNPAKELLNTLSFAARKHSGQRRKDADASPYINHPIALANVLANEGGIDDLDVLCAAILHDTIEDTGTTEDELRKTFGPSITAIVLEVTDDKTLPKDERKKLQVEHASTRSPKAKLVKLADKICNLRDLLQAPPADWDATRKQGYFDWVSRIAQGLHGSHPVLEKTLADLLKRRSELESGQP